MKKIQERYPTLHQALKRFWGYDELRPMQGEVIDSVLDGEDTLAIMSTGAGKSLTYQLPAVLSSGITIVISPLISLIKDQVDDLRARGISAVALHSGLSPRQIDVALDNCIYGSVKLLYIAPERIASRLFQARVVRMQVQRVVVDEAHCIWHWGTDFRPAYLDIASLRALLPGVPCLALTASATTEVQQFIIEKLELRTPDIHLSSLRRRNITYVVRHTDDRDGLLRRIVERVEGSGILYVRSREECERLSQLLVREGITSAASYHAALPISERALRQEEWMQGKVRVMVATNAFGMGIDKSDVRFVVHYKMPGSIEEYYQEAGRAGRDGRRSFATLIVSAGDVDITRRRVELDFPSLERMREIYDNICGYLGVCYGDGAGRRLPINIYEFCQSYHLTPREVLVALRILHINNYLHFSDLDVAFSSVIFLASREELFALRESGEEWGSFVTALTRMLSSEKIFSEEGTDENEVAWWMRLPVSEVRERLERLHQMGYIYYVRSKALSQIVFGRDRVEKRYLYLRPESFVERKRINVERAESMISYCENSTQCRSQIIEQYFDAQSPEPCGVCDICLAAAESADHATKATKAILEALSNGAELDMNALSRHCAIREELILEAIERLLKSGEIIVVRGFFYRRTKK